MPKLPKLPKRYWDDIEWSRKHLSELHRKYEGKWVAIVNKKVVAAGKNLASVRARAMRLTKAKHVPVRFVERGTVVY